MRAPFALGFVLCGALLCGRLRDDSAVGALPILRVAAIEQSASVATAQRDAIDLAHAHDKYALLISQARSAERGDLLELLAQRERQANDYEAPERDSALAQLDARIRAQLHPSDSALFDALADSDAQLAKLAEFRGGALSVAPLTDEQSLWVTGALLRQAASVRAIDDESVLRLASAQLIVEAGSMLSPAQLELFRAYETTELARALSVEEH